MSTEGGTMDYVWLKNQGRMSPQSLSEINLLLKRLSPNSPVLEAADLERLAGLPGTHIVLCLDRGKGMKIVGMARLTAVSMLVGMEGVVADVVVDQDYTGKYIGKMLMTHLIQRGKEIGLRRLALMCWQENQAANRLYTSLGFEKLGVNTYRLKL